MGERGEPPSPFGHYLTIDIHPVLGSIAFDNSEIPSLVASQPLLRSTNRNIDVEIC